MPYVDEVTRELMTPTVPLALKPGELNYQLTVVIKAFWDNHERNYQTVNDIKGALQGALAEFDRQIVAPFEDEKIELNGGIW